MTNSLNSPNALLPEVTDGIGGVDISKDLLYGEYLNQERNTTKLNNEIKRKAVHKALDLPLDDPMNITTNTTHNHHPSSQSDPIKQLEQTLVKALTQTQVLPQAQGVPKNPLGSLLKYGVVAALGALVPGGFLLGPVVAKVADQILNPPFNAVSTPIPQEATKLNLNPTPGSLATEVDELKAYITALKNKKYIVRHFDKNGNEIYIQPLPESLNHGDASPSNK